jgi:hypothetical protein
MKWCWDDLPENRPSFDECVAYLKKLKFPRPSSPCPNYIPRAEIQANIETVVAEPLFSVEIGNDIV